MEQSLQGVSFPKAAAAKAELLQHNHDAAEPWSGSNPHPWKRKGIARPWMGWGVGDGKEKVILQDQMMKRKRDGGTASTVSAASGATNESALKSSEKFELDYLRHDGHFCSEQGQKKGPVCTFVKQYFRQKWRDNNPETQPMSKTKRLEYRRAREEVEPWSRSKRLDYTRRAPTEGSKSKGLGSAPDKEETQLVIKNKREVYTPERVDTPLLSTGLEDTTAREGTRVMTLDSEGQLYPPAREEIHAESNIKSLEYTTAREEETQLMSGSKNLEYTTAVREEEAQAGSRSKNLDYTTAREGTQAVSKINGSKYTMEMEETQPVRRRNSLEDYPTAREETETMSKIKRLEFAMADGETKAVSKSSDYALIEELEGESPTSASSKTKWGLPCGTDCNQVRTDIFRKTNSLMRRKPEKLHIKARPKPSTSSDEDEDPGPISAEHHQAVQTVFTENKKVQTSSHEPKQVQWAILPKDTLSPKVHRLLNEFQRHPKDMRFFRDDSVLMKVSVEPSHEIPAKDELHFDREIDNCGRGILEPQADSPYLGGGKRASAPHHVLLYQEALEIAKEQRDLDKAREQRQEFWSVYEQELKRGRGWHAEESKSERKGKWASDEETPSYGEEASAPGKARFNAFVDEHLNLGSTTPVTSSTRDESGSNQEAEAIFKQLLEKVESYETSPKGDDLVGLQGLRKIQAADNLQSIEAMEQQLNPETSQATAQLSPTELDCMKAAILSHSFYPRLVTSFINQHKAGAPPDQVARLEKIRGQVMESWRPSGSPVTKPAHEEKIKKYQDILTKFERELEKPFQDAMDFSWHMEHYLDSIPPSRGRSEIGSSGSNNLKDFDGAARILGQYTSPSIWRTVLGSGRHRFLPRQCMEDTSFVWRRTISVSNSLAGSAYSTLPSWPDKVLRLSPSFVYLTTEKLITAHPIDSPGLLQDSTICLRLSHKVENPPGVDYITPQMTNASVV